MFECHNDADLSGVSIQRNARNVRNATGATDATTDVAIATVSFTLRRIKLLGVCFFNVVLNAIYCHRLIYS